MMLFHYLVDAEPTVYTASATNCMHLLQPDSVILPFTQYCCYTRAVWRLNDTPLTKP